MMFLFVFCKVLGCLGKLNTLEGRLNTVDQPLQVAKGSDGKWAVKAGSRFNKRYTGNSLYRAGGPAAGLLSASIKGMLNNCSSGRTPWGTYLTCEETTDNYLDPVQPENDYGWVVEIDPYQELAAPTKRTAMGRFSHENVAHMTDANNRVAFYMGDDATPGCIYKFVCERAFSATNRAASRLDVGGAVVVGVVPKCATHVLGRDGIRVREGRPRADIDEDVVSRRGRRDMEAVRV